MLSFCGYSWSISTVHYKSNLHGTFYKQQQSFKVLLLKILVLILFIMKCICGYVVFCRINNYVAVSLDKITTSKHIILNIKFELYVLSKLYDGCHLCFRNVIQDVTIVLICDKQVRCFPLWFIFKICKWVHNWFREKVNILLGVHWIHFTSFWWLRAFSR